jgi:large subunit ribosomal protein L25
MKQLPLSVKLRPAEQQGSANSGRLRRSGFFPAEVYGREAKNLSVVLPTKEFTKMLSTLNGENVLFALQVEGSSDAPILALVKEIQFGRMDHSVQHVDFLKVKMDEKIRVRVPLRVLNASTCAGLKEGGSLEHLLRTIELKCLPNVVPDHLDVDAAPLTVGASIHVSDVKVPEGVKVLTDPKTVVLTVAAQMAEEKVAVVAPVEGAAAPAAGAAGAAGAPAAGEPEVLTAKKKEEGAAAAGDAKKPADKGGKK